MSAVPSPAAFDPVRASQDRLRARLLERARASAPPGTPPGPRSGDGWGSEPPEGASARPPPSGADADALGVHAGETTTGTRRAHTPDLEEWGASLKRVKTFSAESEAELDSYCKRGWDAPARQSAMMFVVQLENRDLLKTIKRDQSGVIDTGTRVTWRHHAQLFQFAPNLAVYRGKRGQLAPLVLDVMRVLKIKALPVKRETAQVKLAHSAISKELRDYRHGYFAKVKSSVTPAAKYRNLAALAHDIAPAGAIITLVHYMRVAFIRWHVIQFPALAGEDFWKQVDKTIRNTFATMSKEIAREWFNEIYLADKEEFGAPEDSGLTAESVKDVPADQAVVELHATRVPMEVADGDAPPDDGAGGDGDEGSEGEGGGGGSAGGSAH